MGQDLETEWHRHRPKISLTTTPPTPPAVEGTQITQTQFNNGIELLSSLFKWHSFLQ